MSNYSYEAESIIERIEELEQLISRKDEELVCLREETKDLRDYYERKLENCKSVAQFWKESYYRELQGVRSERSERMDSESAEVDASADTQRSPMDFIITCVE